MTSWKELSRDDKIDAIRSAYAAVHPNVSMSAMADHLSKQFGAKITRNVVAGFYNRSPNRFTDCPLQPVGGEEHLKAKRVAEPKVKPLVDFRQARHVKKKPDPVKVAEVVAIEQRDPPPGFGLRAPLRVKLIDLGRYDCRWPVGGEKANTKFCGHDCQPGKPYCKGHARLAYSPSARKDRELDAQIKRVA